MNGGQGVENTPSGVVGVVGCANSIEVELLHELNILQHRLLLDCLATQRVMLMSVDACKQCHPRTWAHSL